MSDVRHLSRFIFNIYFLPYVLLNRLSLTILLFLFIILCYAFTGLFPTLDQLQLLNVLLDNKVTHKMIGSFWKDVIKREWGESVTEDRSHDR